MDIHVMRSLEYDHITGMHKLYSDIIKNKDKMSTEKSPVPTGHIRNEDGSFSLDTSNDKNFLSNSGAEFLTESEKNAEDAMKKHWGSVKDFNPIIENEPPLTHHQQAVKDFMVAMVNAVLVNPEKTGLLIDKAALEQKVSVSDYIANSAGIYADAFINQISKK